MDIQLPGINGIEALRQLRADAATAAIPVMAVTASAMTHDRQKILAAGFDAYQSKPISVRPFLELVREVLDRPARGSHERAGPHPGRRRHAGQRQAAGRPARPPRATRSSPRPPGAEALAEDRRRRRPTSSCSTS